MSMSPDDVKATWHEGPIQIVMREPKSKPCNTSCPWMVANHGKTMPYAYDHEVAGIPFDPECTYTPEKYRVAWSALRHGKPGTRPTRGRTATGQPTLCHIARRGTEYPTLVACQCTGALVLQQREAIRHREQ